MYFKCELVVDGYAHDVSEDLKNWDDISISYKRNDYDGVVRSFSTKFEFVNSAYSLLKQEFRNKYLSSSATVIVYKRNNSWLWNELFRCSLDFSTFSDDGYVISINAIDNSLASVIKAKKGTSYEYLVDDIKDEKKLYYDRLDIYNSVKYYPYDVNYGSSNPKDPEGDEVVINFSDNVTAKGYLPFPLIFSDSSEIYNGKVAEVIENSSNGEILKFSGTNSVRISMKFHLKRSDHSAFEIRLISVQGSLRRQIGRFYKGNGDDFDVDYSVNVNKEYLSKGSILAVDFSTGYDYNGWIAISNFEFFEVRYNSVDTPVDIDVITPVSLLNRLLKSMNNNEGEVVGSIESGIDERLDTALLVSAESIRGLSGAKIYTSYTKFEKWMEAEFGFVPVIGEKTVSFVHRNGLYKKDIAKKIEKKISDFEYSVNSSLIYASVKVGYDKQDYDSINGRDEFRFTNEFTTGNTLTDNKLELISPYRADAYGIEFLAQKRGQDTTDNDSDNDTFFVSAKLRSDGSKYELIRSGNGGPSVSGVISPSNMFNVMYSPRKMVEANKEFIGASVSRLMFASSDGNSDVTIDGIKETSDLLIENRLFTVGELSFGTSDLDVPSDWAGRISVMYMDGTYECHVTSAKISCLKNEEVKYSLIVDEIQ